MFNKLLLLLLPIFAFSITHSVAQNTDALRKKHFNTKNSLALAGYDVISYFSGKPVKGSADHQFTYNGIIYHFSSPAHFETFKANPAIYEPQFGGWCAYAMGNTGEKVEVDPRTYKIIQGKLYLFYNRYFTNTLKSWNENESNLLPQANKNWNKIYK